VATPSSGLSLWATGCALALLAALATLSGCGDACEDLQVICDRCLDPNQKLSCETFIDQAVDEDQSDICEEQIDAYDDICPL